MCVCVYVSVCVCVCVCVCLHTCKYLPTYLYKYVFICNDTAHYNYTTMHV